MLWAESEGVGRTCLCEDRRMNTRAVARDSTKGKTGVRGKNRPGRDRSSSLESHGAQGGVGVGLYEPLTPWSTGAMSRFGWKHLCVAVYTDYRTVWRVARGHSRTARLGFSSPHPATTETYSQSLTWQAA